MSRPISTRAADDALANVGVHEDGSSNSGQYVNIYLRSVGANPGDPWCAAFAHYRLAASAKEQHLALPASLPRSAYTPDYKAWAVRTDRWIPQQHGAGNVQKGDLALFYGEKAGRIHHVGIVLEVHDWGVTTVEGNTSAGPGVEPNGGGVYRKERKWDVFGSKGGFAKCDF